LTLSATGTKPTVKWRKRIQFDRDGVSVDADINVAMAVNTDSADSTQEVRSVSQARVVQDSRRPPEETPDADASKPSARSTDD
jgi:hypothetical protein